MTRKKKFFFLKTCNWFNLWPEKVKDTNPYCVKDTNSTVCSKITDQTSLEMFGNFEEQPKFGNIGRVVRIRLELISSLFHRYCIHLEIINPNQNMFDATIISSMLGLAKIFCLLPIVI